jgi:HD superfamily phosphohydrolase
LEHRYKVFSDPVHGFVSVPHGLLLALVEQPEVQRLRRIRQLGVGHLVFPGAEHSRFGHALGAMALMQEALGVLMGKGTPVSDAEYTAALAAALLHDIGHGPFSHTLEPTLMRGVHHEQVSRALIVSLNRRLRGALDLTLRIFDNAYERPFFHRLVSGQLDVDRLDYLRRDSYFTGVVEGEVGVDRLIKTLRVEPSAGGAGSRLVVESKGIYAVENFLVSRRLMYWQVYLHKTVLAGDFVLRMALLRAQGALRAGDAATAQSCAPSLRFFLERDVTPVDLGRADVQDAFAALDDADVLVSLKAWQQSADPVLAELSRRFIHRRLPVVTFLDAPPTPDEQRAWQREVERWLVARELCSAADACDQVAFFLHFGEVTNTAYSEPILIRERDGRIQDFARSADFSLVGPVRRPVVKPYVCAPRGVGPG